MSFPLIKVSASGNKFLILDTRYSSMPSPQVKDYTSFREESILDKIVNSSAEERKNHLDKLQNHFSSVKKFDGLCILKNSNDYDFVCDFFNCDGSTAELCGNASCALTFYENLLSKKEEFYFKFGMEDIKSFKKENYFWIQIKNFDKPKKQTFRFNNKNIPYFFIKVGIPHGVFKWDVDLNPEELRPLATQLREQKNINVSFFKQIDIDTFKALSYERGLEDFTLACGTGALAVALVFENENPDFHLKRISLRMPGGELKVQLKPYKAFSSNPKLGY